MAITITHGVSTANTTDGTTTSTGALTPAAGDLLVAFVTATATVAPGTFTDSQGTKYTLLGTAVKASSLDRTYAFIANSFVTATSTTFTFDCTGDAHTGAVIEVVRIGGMTIAGAAAVLQFAITNNGAAAGTPAVTFANAINTNNPTLGHVSNATNPATMTPPTGWTELVDTGYVTPTTGAETVGRVSGSTATAITWGSTSASAFCAIGMELDAGAAPTTGLVQVKTSGKAATTTNTVLFDKNIILGNVIVLGSNDTTGTVNTISTVADSLGNTYTRQVSDTEASFVDGEVWTAPVTTGGACTITVTYGVSTDSALVAAEYTGISSATPDKTQKAHATTGTALSSGATATTTQANEVVVGFGMGNGTAATKVLNGTGYSHLIQLVQPSSGALVAIEDKLVSSTGAQTATMTQSASGDWVMLVITLKVGTSAVNASVAQVAATVIATGGTQSIATVSNSAITQVHATLTSTGGTQGVAAQSIPTVALNTPADTATGIALSPTLDFTGTDSGGDAITYEIEVDTVNTFDGQPNYSVVDSYSETNQDTNTGISSAFSFGIGQSVTGNGLILGRIRFYLASQLSPTGNAVAKVYAHSGTFGTSSVPTGVALATSDNFDVTGLSSSPALTSFTFSGANQITLSNATNYVISIEYSGGNATNYVKVYRDGSSPTHGGNSMFKDSGGVWTAQSTADTIFYVDSVAGAPLIDKLSATDIGFVDLTNGAHTDPFTSGEQIGYTVQSTLTASTQYFWRVRGKDPSGSNTFGAWGTTRSFTTSAGSVSASVSQVAATLTATGGTQTISAVIIASASITQIAGTLTATGGTQSIATVNKVSVTQVAGNVTATGGTQSIATSNFATITQVAGILTTSGGTQSIVTTQSSSITQLAATITASGGTQTVASSQKGSVTQVAATITASGGTQTIATVNNVTIAQLAATLTATGGLQATNALISVTVTQVAGTVTAAGGTQSVATVNNSAITQLHATLTATGGTQVLSTSNFVTLTQIGATITGTGGTQTVSASTVGTASITQIAANITANGGTQTAGALSSVAITQTHATLTATTGTQTVGIQRAVLISQLAASLTAQGGTNGIVISVVQNDEIVILSLVDTLQIKSQIDTLTIKSQPTDSLTIKSFIDSLTIKQNGDATGVSSAGADELVIKSFTDSLLVTQ